MFLFLRQFATLNQGYKYFEKHFIYSTVGFSLSNVFKIRFYAAAEIRSWYFLTLLATLISTYLSPMETTRPPISEASTLTESLMFSLALTNC